MIWGHSRPHVHRRHPGGHLAAGCRGRALPVFANVILLWLLLLSLLHIYIYIYIYVYIVLLLYNWWISRRASRTGTAGLCEKNIHPESDISVLTHDDYDFGYVLGMALLDKTRTAIFVRKTFRTGDSRVLIFGETSQTRTWDLWGPPADLRFVQTLDRNSQTSRSGASRTGSCRSLWNKSTPSAQASALQRSGRDCCPAPDLVFA